MSISEEKVIDFITIDHKTGDVFLSISDHLPWDDMESDHLAYLAKKLESYLAFVESGELNRRYPGYEDRKVVINLVQKYTAPENIDTKLNQIKELIGDSNISFQWGGID